MVAPGSRFLFPTGDSYDLAHRWMISYLWIFHKLYLNPRSPGGSFMVQKMTINFSYPRLLMVNSELSLSPLIPESFLLPRAGRFAEWQHQYFWYISYIYTYIYAHIHTPVNIYAVCLYICVCIYIYIMYYLFCLCIHICLSICIYIYI